MNCAIHLYRICMLLISIVTSLVHNTKISALRYRSLVLQNSCTKLNPKLTFSHDFPSAMLRCKWHMPCKNRRHRLVCRVSGNVTKFCTGSANCITIMNCYVCTIIQGACRSGGDLGNLKGGSPGWNWLDVWYVHKHIWILSAPSTLARLCSFRKRRGPPSLNQPLQILYPARPTEYLRGLIGLVLKLWSTFQHHLRTVTHHLHTQYAMYVL